MKAREYEKRRRALEDQLHGDLNLIRAGYEAKLRALEMIWLASDEKDGVDSAPGSPDVKEALPSETVSDETVREETASSETDQSETVQHEQVRTETPVQTPAREVPRGDLLSDLLGVLPRLPELFEKKDIFQALGYVPPRATLYRVIGTLREEKKIAIARHSDGGKRTQYRKLG